MRVFRWFWVVALLVSVTLGRVSGDSTYVYAVAERQGVVESQDMAVAVDGIEDVQNDIATVVAVVLLVLVVVLALTIFNNSVKGGS